MAEEGKELQASVRDSRSGCRSFAESAGGYDYEFVEASDSEHR